MEEISGNQRVSITRNLRESFESLSCRIKAYCKENEYKGLENKITVAAALYKLADFIDAESLWLKIPQEKKISRATVYLVLKWLVLHDFAVKKHSGKRMFIYHLKSPEFKLYDNNTRI